MFLSHLDDQKIYKIKPNNMKLKEKMMNAMMDKQMSTMSADEKKDMMNSMMEKFFETMNEDEKQTMMKEMMPMMMEKMMSPGGHGMMDMMSMMMGNSGEKSHAEMQDTGNTEECCKEGGEEHHGKGAFNNPMEMCMRMMQNMRETKETARFATPELRLLFDEWCQQIEAEILKEIEQSKKIEPAELSAKLKLTQESVKFLLSNMARSGKIDFKPDNE
jgi:hypothetical protein